MKKKYYQLPHDYLSYSQCSLWKADKSRYKSLYFDGRDELRTANSGQVYGRLVADSLEKGIETGDLLTDSATLLLPKYDVMDQPIEAEMKTKGGWLKLIARPDTFDSKTCAFRETKTGLHSWTQAKAQNHPQMIFYAVVIWLKYGIKLDKADLDWIETERVEGETRPTGRVETFPVTFSPLQYLECMAEMTRAAKEIELAWASHITNPALTTF